MSPPRVLMAGLSCIDHVWHVARFPPTGSRTHASAYASHGGGPAATAAAAAARLGSDAALWALHGDDANGWRATRELEALGVDCEAVRHTPEAVTFVSAVLVDPHGERYIFPFRGAGLDDRGEGWPWARVDVSDVLLTDGRHPRMAEAALTAANRHGVTTVGDWSDERHWALTAQVDHLLVSEECAAEALARHGTRAGLRQLRSRAGGVVGVTLGADGVLLDDGARAVRVPAAPVEVVDTTGAGDVFHGAYAHALGEGRGAIDAARFAAAAAALSCTGIGRSALPAAAAVEALLARHPLTPTEVEA